MLGQRLSTILAEGMSIQIDTGVESTAWVKWEKFPGKVPALPCKEPIRAAEEGRMYIDGLLAVSIWSDRSMLDYRSAGAGLA